MTSRKIACALSALVMSFGMSTGLVMPLVTYADGEEPTVVTTPDELNDALYYGGNYILGADIDTSGCQWGTPVYAMHDTVLDLADYTITLPDAQASIYTYGANLTIKGGQGKIVKAVENTDYPTIYVYDGDITFEGGNIEGKKFPVLVKDGNSFTMTGGSVTGNQFGIVSHGVLTIGGGTINADQAGVAGYDLAEVTINGGTINSNHYAVTGNGTEIGTKFYINGGTMNGNVGVYLPQIDGATVVTGGTINANSAGIEVRSGSLDISDVTINVIGDVEYNVVSNGGGPTTTGAAVAVAQHTTRNPINVNISGGIFSAPVAFSEADPQDGDPVDVAVSITGGDFDATSNEAVVISEDVNGFIAGGTYNKGLEAKYIADGYDAGLDNHDRWAVVNLAELDAAGDEIDLDWNDEKRIFPKRINFAEEGGIRSSMEEEGQIPVFISFGNEFIADRKATLSATEVETSGLKLSGDGELIGALDLTMYDRDPKVIKVSDNELTVCIDIDEETYNALKEYSELYAVYFDHNGEEVERFNAELKTESYTFEDETWTEYWIEFNTTHLSTYGIVGSGSANTSENGTSEATDDAGTPETGTMTASGASASVASIVTAFAVGIMTSIISFAYLIRRR